MVSRGRTRALAAIGTALFVGLTLVHDARAQESVAQGTLAEICEAFPWDVPVEQSFTVASVLRWRRAMDGMRQDTRSAMPRSPRTAGR
jgi:hypothetical protein